MSDTALRGAEADTSAVLGIVDGLMTYARANLLLDPRDEDWMRNRMLELFNANEELCSRADLLAKGLPEDVPEALLNDDEVMGALSALPSRVEDEFGRLRASDGGMEAMQWLYDYGVANGYIKLAQLNRNIRFNSAGLVITINTAKPEFTDMRKAARGNSVGGSFAQCTICHANEGLASRDKRTLRTAQVELDGSPWFWQFSPYGYFRQHGICVNREHTPMHVDESTFRHLLDFVSQFPEYFLGCNAALPRIGGSVLAHDHYQGGGEVMPMQRAVAWKRFLLPEADDAVLEIVDWPATALRIRSRNSAQIVRIAELIREAWSCYDNAGLGIASHGDAGEAQSSVSPIARLISEGDGSSSYEMSLILRNNAVSEQYPLGVFHAHPEYFFIKQEPIGLIEAMGLFVLPGRLVTQLGELERALLAGDALPGNLVEFRLAWDEVRADLGEQAMPDESAVREALRREVASICRRILGNIAVFPGHAETEGFLRELGFVPLSDGAPSED